MNSGVLYRQYWEMGGTLKIQTNDIVIPLTVQTRVCACVSACARKAFQQQNVNKRGEKEIHLVFIKAAVAVFRHSLYTHTTATWLKRRHRERERRETEWDRTSEQSYLCCTMKRAAVQLPDCYYSCRPSSPSEQNKGWQLDIMSTHCECTATPNLRLSITLLPLVPVKSLVLINQPKQFFITVGKAVPLSALILPLTLPPTLLFSLSLSVHAAHVTIAIYRMKKRI